MELKTLIAECTVYDFKVMLEEKKPKSWLRSVSAFANGLGGSFFFGIDNEGIVKRLDDVQHVCETISSRIRDYMDPLHHFPNDIPEWYKDHAPYKVMKDKIEEVFESIKSVCGTEQ